MQNSKTDQISKTYNPSEVEDKWYQYWLKNNLFSSDVDWNKKSYTIVIPPPNITGSLTMGHILNNTIQDIYIRYKRMLGFNACWVPGTDHASIATESKVTKFLSEKGIDKFQIGREEFLKYCYEWKNEYGGMIIQQLKKLGVSCDWRRERFTMDEHYYKKVIEAFVQLYNEGKIYRGFKMVNWCPASKSAISDEEVIRKTVDGNLWHLKYPIKNSNEFITVATTRPETMLGDTGIAVNPNDKRYTSLIGKIAILPLVNRELPIFADDFVDATFGTGAVKVTPAHDFNDYEMGLKHKLKIINIFYPDASTNENVPEEFQNLDRYNARKLVVQKLNELNLIEKIENYQNNVGYSERGHVPIEPYLSEQWFMKMSELAKPALDTVEKGQVRFHPQHWIKTYEHWMKNIKDWCISRQLWWGHRIPVWYCIGDDHCNLECKKPIVSVTVPEKCPHCGSRNLKQDEDVLDTWASSWLWAHEVFKNEEEQKYYYPTDTLVTGPDIIFFWVARMIIAGLHFKNDIPFKDVYFTSIIRDSQGRKMSKSLGNSPDPLEVIKEYGADALRFTAIYLAPLGQDVLFSVDKCEIGRNFANKIWNAGRFLSGSCLMNELNILDIDYNEEDFIQKWILSRLHQSLKELKYAMDNFEINNATKIIYSFVWNDFCDWYIELIKYNIYSNDDKVKSKTLYQALIVFEDLLKIVHPFMPFISEELFQLIVYPFLRKKKRKECESISISDYPRVDLSKVNLTTEKEMEFLQNIIIAIRNIRGEMNIAPSKQIKVFLRTEISNHNNLNFIKRLVKAEEIIIDKNLDKPSKSASAIVKNCEIFIPLEGIIDLQLERARLEKEIQRLENGLIGVNKKLSNQNFINNAPADILDKEKQKKNDWDEKIIKYKNVLNNLN